MEQKVSSLKHRSITD